ncbi:hypothetical protein MQA17_25605 [Escherichia coli]|nr:hypothetical protein [Escherichia coli]MCI3756304.1 hypothetical protein [Escherichia coli]
MQLTEQQVITQVADLMDRNHNNIVTSSEIVLGFRDILGVELPVSDFLILAMDEAALLDLAALFGFELLREDFVNGWVARFHDSPEFVGAVFDAFDVDGDGVLLMGEVEGILNLMRATSDADHNRVITRAEFIHFFTYIYSC